MLPLLALLTALNANAAPDGLNPRVIGHVAAHAHKIVIVYTYQVNVNLGVQSQTIAAMTRDADTVASCVGTGVGDETVTIVPPPHYSGPISFQAEACDSTTAAPVVSALPASSLSKNGSPVTFTFHSGIEHAVVGINNGNTVEVHL
jgi:hypothetical protein